MRVAPRECHELNYILQLFLFSISCFLPLFFASLQLCRLTEATGIYDLFLEVSLKPIQAANCSKLANQFQLKYHSQRVAPKALLRHRHRPRSETVFSINQALSPIEMSTDCAQF